MRELRHVYVTPMGPGGMPKHVYLSKQAARTVSVTNKQVRLTVKVCAMLMSVVPRL